MFEAALAFDDLGAPAVVDDGGVRFGRSTVRPVRHRHLRTSVLESSSRVAIVSYERFRDDKESDGHETGLSGAELDRRVAKMAEHPFDYGILILTRSPPGITYRASAIVSVPVYLRRADTGIRIDWDYSRLLGADPVDVVWEKAIAQIAGISTYGPETIVAGVYRSTADGAIIVTPDDISFTLPTANIHDGPHRLAPTADVEDMVFETVRSLLAARDLDRARTALELSGGMDSALTSLAAAAAVGPGLMTMGAQFGGAMGEAQRERRRLLCSAGGFEDLEVPARRFAPFGSRSLRRRRYGVWPEDENYPEIFEAMFGMLQSAGIDTLVSGFGGDELYFAYEGEEAPPGVDADTSPFLTDTGRDVAHSLQSAYPQRWLQESCFQSAASQSQRLLRYGLWPIYPYHNVALARFVGRLPWDWRRDRRLLRRILTRRLGTPVFETKYLKETFHDVAVQGICENRDFLIGLVTRSPLSAHPAIDARAITGALSGRVERLSPAHFNSLFSALKLYCFFGEETENE